LVDDALISGTSISSDITSALSFQLIIIRWIIIVIVTILIILATEAVLTVLILCARFGM